MAPKLTQHDIDFFNAYALHFRQAYIQLANERKALAAFCSRHPSSLPSLYDSEFISISFSKQPITPEEDFVIKTINLLHLLSKVYWADDIWKTFLVPARQTMVKGKKYKSTYYGERSSYIPDFCRKISEHPDIVQIIESEIVPNSTLSIL